MNSPLWLPLHQIQNKFIFGYLLFYRVVIKQVVVLDRILPRLIILLFLSIALRPSLKDSPCQECQDLEMLSNELLQNFSLLAETGYAEGVMCHTLVKGDTARYRT